MKKIVYVLLAISIIPLAASETPQHQYTDFFSNGDITRGEPITFGVQYAKTQAIDYVTASLYNADREIDYTTLIDRNNDNFFTGTLNGVEALNDYRITINACNSDGCTTKRHYKQVQVVDWEDRLQTHRSPVLPH